MDQLEISVSWKIRENIFLYNYLSDDYHNKNKKKATWISIADDINSEKIPGAVFKTGLLIKALYTMLRGEYRNVQDNMRTHNIVAEQLEGRDADVYNYMGFLKYYVHSYNGDAMI